MPGDYVNLSPKWHEEVEHFSGKRYSTLSSQLTSSWRTFREKILGLLAHCKRLRGRKQALVAQTNHLAPFCDVTGGRDHTGE